MKRCPLCQERSPERFCPALGKRICSICCGENRRRSISCPPSCEFLIAAERKLWERRGKELSRDWERLAAHLREKGREHLVPMLQVLRESLAQGVHKLDADDAGVIAALEYCARKLSPIELLEHAPNILGRALEETLVPLIQSGRIDRELVREALEVLAGFAEYFSGKDEKDGKRFVHGLLGLYPPPKRRPSPIIRPSEGRIIVRD